MTTGRRFPAGRNRPLLTRADKLDLGISLMEMAGSLNPSGRPLKSLVCVLYFLIGLWLVRNA